MLKHSLGVTNERFPDETNDCAVIALANVADIPYHDAHIRLSQQGRRRRKGARFSFAVAALMQLIAEGKIDSGRQDR
jgi:hypothetical protein